MQFVSTSFFLFLIWQTHFLWRYEWKKLLLYLTFEQYSYMVCQWWIDQLLVQRQTAIKFMQMRSKTQWCEHLISLNMHVQNSRQSVMVRPFDGSKHLDKIVFDCAIIDDLSIGLFDSLAISICKIKNKKDNDGISPWIVMDTWPIVSESITYINKIHLQSI